MGLSAAHKEDWRWFCQHFKEFGIQEILLTLLMWCSLDEDKIFERILADNWEAKDKSVTQTFLQ